MACFSGGLRRSTSEDEKEAARPGQIASETHLSEVSTLIPEAEKFSRLRRLFKRRPKTSATKDHSM